MADMGENNDNWYSILISKQDFIKNSYSFNFRLFEMSFLSLYEQKRKALEKLRQFKLIADNCDREATGKPLLVDRRKI